MKNVFFFLFLFLFSCSKKKDESTVVYARVENQVLNQKNTSLLFFEKEENKKNLSSFVDSWVDETVLFLSAKKEGLLKDHSLIKKRDAFYKDLVVSTFIENKTTKMVTVSNKEIKNYYDKHKNTFLQDVDMVFAEQYILENPSRASKLFLSLQLNKLKKIGQIPHTFRSGYVKRGFFSNKADLDIFNKRIKIIGPIKNNNLYYVLKIVKRFKRGSQKGLEEMYDEIYQRIYKKKQALEYVSLLDSLKNSMSVYINQGI